MSHAALSRQLAELPVEQLLKRAQHPGVAQPQSFLSSKTE